MGSKIVTGEYVPGLNHSRYRPRLYDYLGTALGTINLQLPPETDDSILIPRQTVEGRDDIDVSANQNFLIRRCKLKGVDGYQILPVDKATGAARGLHVLKRIEVTLEKRISIQHGDIVAVELMDFDE